MTMTASTKPTYIVNIWFDPELNHSQHFIQNLKIKYLDSEHQCKVESHGKLNSHLNTTYSMTLDLFYFGQCIDKLVYFGLHFPGMVGLPETKYIFYLGLL